MATYTHKFAFLLIAVLLLAAGISWSQYQQEGKSSLKTSQSGDEAAKVIVGSAKSFPLSSGKMARRDDQKASQDTFKIDIENLLKLADIGDFAAAQTAFRESTECGIARSEVVNTTVDVNVCAQETRPDFVDKCQARASELNERLQSATEKAKPCAGLSREEEMNLRYRAARIAAKLGDVDAQMCVSDGDYDMSVLHPSDDEREQYKKDGMSYFNQAIDRGDWRAIEALNVRRQALGHGRLFLNLLTEGDEHTVYRMRRLLRYGAIGTYAERLDADLSDYLSAHPDAFADDDLWAKQQYDEHFATAPRLEKKPTVCGQPL